MLSDEQVKKMVSLKYDRTFPGYARSAVCALLADRKALLRETLEALKAAQHDIDTSENLICCDGFDEYHKAQREGCDANGAWDCFVEVTFTLKHSSYATLGNTIAKLEAVLNEKT